MIFSLASLTRQDALLALKVHRFVTQDLNVNICGSSLLIALSGGLDSTALLVLLAALRQHGQFTLYAAHLDHGLRPESGADAEFCVKLCQSLNIPFRFTRCDVRLLSEQKSIGLEEAGREARYTFLNDVRHEVGAAWIVTAHHADDLAEDVLLRLTRGAAWPGLGGMRAVDLERHLLRPLLMQDKTTLREFLCRNSIPWVEDASNTTRDFRRNRMRLDVLPLLLHENPSFLNSIRTLWQSARSDEEYWSSLTSSLPKWTPQGILLPASSLLPLPQAARLRAYVSALNLLNHAQARSATLFALDAAWLSKRHKTLQFPNAISASTRSSGILFTSAKDTLLPD